MKFPSIYIFLFLFSANLIFAQTDVSLSVDVATRTSVLSNGIISMSIGNNGIVSSFKQNGKELISGGKFYYDYTDSIKNRAFSPDAVRIKKQTADYGEVVYSRTTGDLILEEGFIIRKGVSGFYTWASVKGTATLVKLREMRMVYRVDPNLFKYGYVSDRMQGFLPSVADMAAVNNTPIMDATYQLPDGSIYTKYNWVNYIVEDSIHGIMSTNNGLWDIPISHEYVNGGPLKQELTVHTTNTTPLFLQMIQGEHMGAAAQYYKNGEQKLYGPFFIYSNTGNSFEEMIVDAKKQVGTQKAQWPFQWFQHDLYPNERTCVKGNISLTPGLAKDSIMIVLAQAGIDIYNQGKEYMFWAMTDINGNYQIDNVRPGTYTLYAYACKGDISEQFSKNNQIIAGTNTQLEDIIWYPEKYQNLLWIIGENDLKSTGFHYSDTLRQYGLYNLPPANLTYTAGASNPAKDWYYAQTKVGSWNIVFNTTETYTGNAVLTASIAGAATTPKVDVYVNGSKKSTWSFSNDASVYRSAVLGGKHSVQKLIFPASSLVKGNNTISLKMTSVGSRGGVIYDCIKLETGGLYTDFENISNDQIKDIAYPNPFNSQTNIRISNPVKGNLQIDIYNIEGELVSNLFKGKVSDSENSFIWNPVNCSSGIYIYRIVLDNQVKSGKLIYER